MDSRIRNCLMELDKHAKGPMVARIVVITHEHDQFLSKRDLFFRMTSPYLLFDILAELKKRGHSIRVQQGVSQSHAADIAVLHVDATVTPEVYVEYASSFPFCLNVEAADISKRRVSGALLKKDDDWKGPVIVKSNLNNKGIPEAFLNRQSERAGKPRPFPDVSALEAYDIYMERSVIFRIVSLTVTTWSWKSSFQK